MDSPPMTTVGMTARIRELEEEMRSLRKLVCHLLQKNEVLRQRPQNRNESLSVMNGESPENPTPSEAL